MLRHHTQARAHRAADGAWGVVRWRSRHRRRGEGSWEVAHRVKRRGTVYFRQLVCTRRAGRTGSLRGVHLPVAASCNPRAHLARAHFPPRPPPAPATSRPQPTPACADSSHSNMATVLPTTPHCSPCTTPTSEHPYPPSLPSRPHRSHQSRCRSFVCILYIIQLYSLSLRGPFDRLALSGNVILVSMRAEH